METKHRRILAGLAALCLLAAIQSQCGCVLGFREAPPSAPPHPVGAIQGELLWAVLFGILGIGVGVFMLVELPFKKLGIAVVAGSASMVGACLYFAWVAEHIGWFVLALSAIGAIALLWGKMRLLGVANAAKPLIDRGAILPAKVQAILNKL